MLPTETVKAIKLLSSGKAPGSDAIPAEINKAGGPPVAEKLTELFHIMWRKEAIPQEFKDATIIHLFKRKGNHQVCDNHRGISLLSIARKILTRFLLNRLNEHLERSRLLFLDLNLCISNGTVSTKIYVKRDDFDFDIVNFPFLDGDVPRRTSYGIYISN